MDVFIINKQRKNNNYLHVDLYNNGKKKTLLVHRLVAENFIPKIVGRGIVNHKNGIKTDNLEWMSQSENILHSHVINNH